MQKARLGKTELTISPVTFGGIIVMDETPETAARYVAQAVDRGINYFDVAPSYGNAEERLGPALAPYRKGICLACKTQERDGAPAKKELLASLEHLQTDYFDVYQLHAMTTQEDIDRAFAEDGALSVALWAKKEGLVRNIGFSTHNEDVAMRTLERYDFDTVLFPMYWAMGINLGWGDRIAEAAKARDMGLLAMKTLIHRAWMDGDDRSTFPKSWCKPISGNDALGVAGMKYGLSKGATTLIPPGNWESFFFMLEHIDEAMAPLTEAEGALLREEARAVQAYPIFTP
ncbi:aldo/keto reductase [Eubacteriales bacterium OttesenSCG-928-A19]|nr:aldo/keto reductase [Eubacteriales bacterium OttesenSCG-928-A19]